MPAAEHLALGRQLLSAGILSRAVDEFRAAQRDPDTLADASNGLGVAYARLGRSDLAERYFRMATAMAPDNQRFAANLARLYQSGEFAAVSAPSYPVRVEIPAAQPAKLATAPVMSGQIQRISRGEVRISSAPVREGAPRARVLAMNDRLPKIVVATAAAAPATDAKLADNTAPAPTSRTIYPQQLLLKR
jgi:hypothetical protein